MILSCHASRYSRFKYFPLTAVKSKTLLSVVESLSRHPSPLSRTEERISEAGAMPAQSHPRRKMKAATASATVAMFLLGAARVEGLDNNLGSTPGMGWNSDYCAGCSDPSNYGASGTLSGFQNEAFVTHIADTLHNMALETSGGKTLQELGYKYINMDASWDTPHRDAHGNLVPDPKLWPNGLDSVVKYVHSLKLGFGLYGDKGTKDCASNPGSLGHEKQDASFLAAHDIDWWKEDSCFTPASRQSDEDQVADFAVMRDALNATGVLHPNGERHGSKSMHSSAKLFCNRPQYLVRSLRLEAILRRPCVGRRQQARQLLAYGSRHRFARNFAFGCRRHFWPKFHTHFVCGMR